MSRRLWHYRLWLGSVSGKDYLPWLEVLRSFGLKLLCGGLVPAFLRNHPGWGNLRVGPPAHYPEILEVTAHAEHGNILTHPNSEFLLFLSWGQIIIVCALSCLFYSSNFQISSILCPAPCKVETRWGNHLLSTMSSQPPSTGVSPPAWSVLRQQSHLQHAAALPHPADGRRRTGRQGLPLHPGRGSWHLGPTFLLEHWLVATWRHWQCYCACSSQAELQLEMNVKFSLGVV